MRPGVLTALALTVCNCAPRPPARPAPLLPATLDPPTPSASAAIVARSNDTPPHEPLGDAVALDLVAGSIVASLDHLIRHGNDQSTWTESGRERIIVGGEELWLVALELAGEDAALVVLRAEAAHFRVIAVLGVSHGGLGASLAVVERWSDASKQTAFVVVQIERRFRGFKTATGKWEYPSANLSWVVLGLRADSAWLARPEDPGGRRLRIVDTPAGPALATVCFVRRRPAGREVLFPYQPLTGKFVGECDAAGSGRSTAPPP